MTEISMPNLDVRFCGNISRSYDDMFSVKAGITVQEAYFDCSLSIVQGHFQLLWADPWKVEPDVTISKCIEGLASPQDYDLANVPGSREVFKGGIGLPQPFKNLMVFAVITNW